MIAVKATEKCLKDFENSKALSFLHYKANAMRALNSYV